MELDQNPVRKKNLSQPAASAQKKRLFRRLSILFLPLSMLFIEWTAHLYLFGFTLNGLWYTTLSALALGTLFLFIVCLFNKKHRFAATAVILALVAAYYSFHMLYYAFFRSFFTFATIGMANALTQFWRGTMQAIVLNFYKILTAFLPFAVLLFFGKKRYVLPKRFLSLHRLTFFVSFCMFLVLTVSILLPPNVRKTFLYMRSDIPSAYEKFGVTVASVDDLNQTIFGEPEEVIDNPYGNATPTPAETPLPETPDEPAATPKTYQPNALNIDFESLIANAPNKTIKGMHEYFSTVPASMQNDYTGLFEGKNLVVLCLEGFSYKTIDPQRTPTLYKMYTEGFKFNNFYDSLWGGSTATGEYANMTGNFYDKATCLKTSGSTLTYSALGNLFGSNGYDTYAYHNHTYTYYSRDVSHPNFGYTYKAIGNGLTLEHSVWPNSDLDMAKATAPDYIQKSKQDGKPFHVYYMTVSGHANYTFGGNNQAKNHKDVVENLSCCDNVKAFHACQYEVELMLADLVRQFSDAGILEDTVFAMCCDHYPYAMSDSELAELYGLPEKGIRSNFELYRNAFILWSACMEEPVEVDTPCSSYDITPTLANLFGIPYESRIIIGTDILSTSENIALINTLDAAGSWNWITEQGTYYVKTKKFVASDSCTLSGQELEDYVTLTKKKVNAMRTYSLAILDNDYYKYVFDKNFKPLKTK